MSVLNTLLTLALADTNIAILFAVFIIAFLFFLCNILAAPIAAGKSILNLLTSSIVLVIFACIATLYLTDKMEKNQIGDFFEASYYWYIWVSEGMYTSVEYVVLLLFGK